VVFETEAPPFAGRPSSLGVVEYPVVRHAHVVPKGYLVNFANAEKMLTLRLKGKTLHRQISIRDAAVRTDFYKRERPDGTVIYDIEWSLQHLENLTAPILRSIRERWPLARDDKAALAALFAYQTVRGPRWKDWHEEFVQERIAEYRSALGAGSQPDPTIGEQIDATERHLLTSTYRHTKMMKIAPKVASLIGSMHWMLLEFSDPCIATSDHPVVAWHVGERTRSAVEPTPLGQGFSDSLEVRIPVSARHAIVATWRDERDAAPIAGAPDHAANINALTVANADRQWFHHPDGTPPLLTESLVPIAPMFALGYSAREAASSRRRGEINRRLAPRIGDDSLEQSFELVFVT
jgi:hypothetical protein